MLFQSSSCEDFLRAELARRMGTNPHYSQRAFARQLGLSPGEMSEILRGKRKLSPRAAKKIALSLGLSPAEQSFWLQLVLSPGARSDTRPRRNLTTDMFAVVSEWYCLSLLALLDCERAPRTERGMAQRLGIQVAEVRFALDRLLRLGLVEKLGGQYKPAKDFVFSPEGIPSEAVKNFHRQMLKKASDAIDTQSLETRENSGISLVLRPEDRAKIKGALSKFLDSLLEKYSSRQGATELYQLEAAFFSLTKEPKK